MTWIHRGFTLSLRRMAPVYIFPGVQKTVVNQLRARKAQPSSSLDGDRRTGLTDIDLPLEEEHVQAIAALSEKLGVGVKEVEQVYQEEFEKLAARARVPNFLSVLALNRTRSILGERVSPD